MTRTNWLLRWFGGGVLAAVLTSALVGAVLAVAVGVEDSMSWADSGESLVERPSDVLGLGLGGALFGALGPDPDRLLGLIVLLPPAASAFAARWVGGRLLPDRPKLLAASS